MRVHLVYPDRDLDLEAPAQVDSERVVQDLALEPVFAAMAGDDALALKAARSVLLAHGARSVALVRYRQDALADCLAHRDAVQALYDCAADGFERVRDLGLLRLYARSPGSTLYSALRVIGAITETLEELRALVAGARDDFASQAFRGLFSAVLDDLDDAFFATVKRHRRELEFPAGMLISARLGPANRGVDLALRRPSAARRRWLDVFRGEPDGGLSFTVAPRDESGHNALRELRDRALNEVANALAQSNDHMLAFFTALRAELAFYLGCVRLHGVLAARGVAVCRPEAQPPDTRDLRCQGLVDVSLALVRDEPVVANDLDADGRPVIVVTGANRGGKTTFLRSVGQAELMMAAGMFTAAGAFRGSLCDGLYSHFKRDEDPSMTGGKLDEELGRLGEIVGRIDENALLLMNESFGSTNEAEGSELARQILTALAERGVRVVFVTHFYEFARAWRDQNRADTLFLRAERLADGSRTFRLLPAEPLDTSFADDVFRRVFASAPA